MVFLLWGKYAQDRGKLINKRKHHVLQSAHPSPYSAGSGFFGNRHFSKTNSLLQKQGKTPIDWELNSLEQERKEQSKPHAVGRGKAEKQEREEKKEKDAQKKEEKDGHDENQVGEEEQDDDTNLV